MDNSKEDYSPRLFIGIKAEHPPELLKRIEHHKRVLHDCRIKWSSIDNLHITLHFLGTTPSYYLNSLELILDQLASISHPFELAFKNTGYFGERKPRVLWLGLEKSKELNALFESLSDSLKQLDFPLEDRTYTPHLTLGRIKHITDMNVLERLTENQEIRITPFTVKQIHLFESISTKNGPAYKILHSAALEA